MNNKIYGQLPRLFIPLVSLDTIHSSRETIEQAAALDLKIREVLKGHPHVEIIDNSTDFNQKVIRVLEAICRILGIRVQFLLLYGVRKIMFR